MSKIYFTVLVPLVFILNSPVLGQLNTYVGIEVARANDLYKIEENGNSLMAVRLINRFGGINIRQEISKKFFFEVGLIRKDYMQGFSFINIRVYSYQPSFKSWLIPVKLGYRIALTKQIFITTNVGFTWSLNSDYPNRVINGAIRSTPSYQYSYTRNADVPRSFFLMHPSIGIERKLFNVLLLSIYGSRSFGFTNINQLDINYTVNNSTPTTGKAISNGGFSSYGISLKYPISKLWAKQ